MKRRNFIKTATAGSIALSGLATPFDLLSTDSNAKRSRLKDNFWLWGQNPGSHHVGSPVGGYKLPGINHMDSKEGCDFFGIDKCLRVTMSTGPFPPFDAEAGKLKDLKEVVWSAIGAGGAKIYSNDNHSDVDEVIRMAKMYPNVTGAVMDDFFHASEEPGKTSGRHSIQSIQNIREKLHSFKKRPLDLWVVWYTYQLDFKVAKYLDLCDVITLWTWKASDLSELDTNFQKMIYRTPGKRRFAGCYMWNYGERKPLTMDQMKFQLDRYYYWLQKGGIEGIIFCSNCIADIGLETVDYTCKWINQVGNEKMKK
jgi:hypothetical protein